MNGRAIGLGLGVVGLSALILLGVSTLAGTQRANLQDGKQLRRVYIALALYESDHGGAPALRLDHARSYIEPRDLVSSNDPGALAKGSQPLDPFVDSLGQFPTRVSITYLPHWVVAGQAGKFDWAKRRFEPRVGVLANPWQGGKLGRVLRVNSDGALYSGRRPLPPTPSFETLFLEQ